MYNIVVWFMVFGWNFFQNLHNFPLSLLGLAVLSFFALLRKTLKTFYIYYRQKWVKQGWSSKSTNARKVGLRVLFILSWEFCWWKPGRRTKMHLDIWTRHILSQGFRPRRTWTTEELRIEIWFSFDFKIWFYSWINTKFLH